MVLQKKQCVFEINMMTNGYVTYDMLLPRLMRMNCFAKTILQFNRHEFGLKNKVGLAIKTKNLIL